jgi:hypothetical protein
MRAKALLWILAPLALAGVALAGHPIIYPPVPYINESGVASGSITSAGTIQAEQLTSTDDATIGDDLDVVDNLTCGDAVIDEAAGVLSFTGATSATISTTVADLTLDPVSGKAVVFGAPVQYTVPATVTVAAAAFTVNWQNGSLQVVDLQSAPGAVTAILSNPTTGGAYLLKIIQGSDLNTITWPAAVKWPGGTAPTITATNNYVDYVTLVYDGTIYMGSYVQDIR